MQSRLVEAITAALERKPEGRLADSTDQKDHVLPDPVMRGSLQRSTPTVRIGHAESGLVEAVIAALEREQQGHLAGGAERKEHVFHDEMMRGELQPSTFARIGQAEVGSVGAVIPALEREQEGHLAGGTARIEHVFHDQVMGGNLQRSSSARMGHAESGSAKAVIPALEREQEASLANATDQIELIVHHQVMRGNLQSIPTATIGHASQSRGTHDSLIKARFASTVLRVAQTSDQKTAARLVRGLANDFPHPNEHQQIAGVHLRAIEAFLQLAAELEDTIGLKQRNLWSTALTAAHDWLSAVSP